MLGALVLDSAAWYVDVLSLDRLDHLKGGDPVRLEPRGLEIHVDLADVSAGDVDRDYAVDLLDPLLQGVVHEGAELLRVSLPR